ncbi:LEAF RUST 10 DISEASE-RESISTANCEUS RECEPTOR-LIKE PROTEIN KINASE-like 2.1 isoform X2 [Miscanthus floridulus]|uniref:LEAF RUST 10 DISEASE-RESISTANCEUS RECEPTOR-LIKE PROTEIN KINASE-like 2.1 isoform X2 n=1 Tax=Miscanthus floridulus TaxID=154761 RepID=UPI00345A3C5F
MVGLLLLRHRRLPLPLLVAILFAASRGDPSSGDYNTSICKLQPYTCGKVNISYPFYLSDETADVLGNNSSSCGYHGLAIDCVDDKYPILQLGSGPDYSYNVTGIDYTNSTISLADPDVLDGDESCPVDHNVTVPPSFWLNLSEYTVDYLLFFANCSISTLPDQPYINPITCPSSLDGYYSFVIPSEVPHQTLSQECKQVIQVPVLQNASLTIDSQWSTNGYRNALKQGFQLGWNLNRKSEQCTKCEGSNGRCAHSRDGEFVACLCTNGRVSNHECTKGHHNKRTRTYIVASTSSLLFLCLVVLTFFLACKHGLLPIKSKDEPRIESFLQKNGNIHPKRYTYADVKRMTKSFVVKLGQGGFGAVYKGNLHDGRQVAVKMLKDTKGDGEEFMNEVVSISRTSHVNVVTLLGFCLQGSKRALIYEYMPNGSLERYAFNSNMNSGNLLSWEKLFDIAIGTARGLEYLHRGCNTRIVHFDIKPHNILLDQDFCPKISDFGLAKLCLNKESAISIAGARGTIGYIAPEVYSKQFGLVSSKSDVYSYGMMVLEMVGARDKNTSENSESSSQYFPQWIYEHLDDYCISASEIDGETTELVRKMIVVGLWCIQVIPTDRPTMTRVVEMLEGSTSNLELPPKVLLSSQA